MAESKRGQDTMKLTMKMGGGGIGAVVLLGGALATAALASAFVVGRNGRSSGHKRAPAPEINKKQSPSSGEIKEVESDKDNVFVVSNLESITLDSNLIVEEINGETPDILCSISPKKLEIDAISDGLIVIEEKTPSLDGKLQFEPQNDDGALTIELINDDADDKNPKESQDPDEKVLIEEKGTEIGEYVGEVRETSHREAVEINEKEPREKENQDGVCCDGEEEEIKVILVDDKEVEMKSDNLEERLVIDNGEMVFSESDSEDGHKAVQPVLESRVIEHENVNGDEKKEILEIVNQPDELIVVEKHESHVIEHEHEKKEVLEIVNQSDELILIEKRENHVIEHEHVNVDEKTEIVEIENQPDEPIVVENRESHVIEHEHEKKEIVEKENQSDELIVIEKCESRVIEHEHVNVDERNETVEIENQADELIVVEKREDPIEVKVEDIIPCDVKEEENGGFVYPMLKEELNVPENVEEEIIEREVKEEVMISPENIEVVESVEANINETSLMEFDVVQAKQDEDEEEEEIEGSSDDLVTEKSEDEVVLSDEARLVDREVGGKIQEDKAVKKGECDSKNSRLIDDDLSGSEFGNWGKTFTIKKYVMNDRLTNSTDRRIIIVTLSVVSSLLCSWFYGLSSAELCLVVFLTMVMSSMVIE